MKGAMGAGIPGRWLHLAVVCWHWLHSQGRAATVSLLVLSFSTGIVLGPLMIDHLMLEPQQWIPAVAERPPNPLIPSAVADGSQRALLVFSGESFRMEGFERGAGDSFHLQQEAAHSHSHFIRHLRETHNVTADVLVVTYTTKYDGDLERWYVAAAPVVRAVFLPAPAGGLLDVRAVHAACLGALNDKKLFDLALYRFVHFIPVDVYLKHFFFDAFKLSSKLRFGSVEWLQDSRLTYGIASLPFVPKVAPALTYIPRRLFSLVLMRLEPLIAKSDAYALLLDVGVAISDIGFYLPTYHHRDTSIDWSPLHFYVGHSQSVLWATRHAGFDRNATALVRTQFPFLGADMLD